MFKINAEDYKLNRADPFEGWDKGYEWGKGLEDSISILTGGFIFWLEAS